MSYVPAGSPHPDSATAVTPGAPDHPDTDQAPPAASQATSAPRRRFSLRLTSLIGHSAPVRASLFGEILDWLLVPLLLLWPISVALTYVAAKSLANAPYDRNLANQAQLLADHVKVERGRTVLALPPAARDLLRADETDQIYYQVISRQGEAVAGERDLPIPEDEEAPPPGQVQFRNAWYRGVELRVALMAVEIPEAVRQEAARGEGGAVPNTGAAASGIAPGSSGTSGGAGSRPPLVQVGETLEKRSQLAGELVKGVILPQFVILPVAVLLVWFGLARGLVPLSRLTERIRARKSADLSPIDPGAAPEEVAPLIRSINDLMGRLEASLEGQQRFVANAAHQLRTPLAGLKTQTELALRQARPGGDASELRESLKQMALSTERAARMVNQLLALTRAEREDHGATGRAFVAVDLEALVRETVRDWVPAAMARRIDLGLENMDGNADSTSLRVPLVIDGDALLLRELLNNLLDNALRYTPAGGVITVRAHRDLERRQAVVEVEDSGIGIAEQERELVFERFYRVLGNDPDGRNLEGSGLGLSIVREIATRHRGRVLLRDNPAGAGALFSASFPLRGAGPPELVLPGGPASGEAEGHAP
jgi:two-component system sensor histidine kinase TctE